MSTSEDPRARFTEELTQRAASDPAFRQLLLSDPRAAISEAFGIQVPDQVTLQVLEESADRVYIVLPAQGEAAPGEDFYGKSPAKVTFLKMCKGPVTHP